jgi:hypothetical protein
MQQNPITSGATEKNKGNHQFRVFASFPQTQQPAVLTDMGLLPCLSVARDASGKSEWYENERKDGDHEDDADDVELPEQFPCESHGAVLRKG